MAAFVFGAAQSTASMAEARRASVPIEWLLMQINADGVCLVRTQFQHLILPTADSATRPLGSVALDRMVATASVSLRVASASWTSPGDHKARAFFYPLP